VREAIVEVKRDPPPSPSPLFFPFFFSPRVGERRDDQVNAWNVGRRHLGGLLKAPRGSSRPPR